jgi:sugar phosphate isomerase/epimerase
VLSRRGLLAGALGVCGAAAQQIPLKIGHRAASMNMVGNFDVFRLASRISGLRGVELQIAQGNPNLWDLDTVRRYKREAHRWGMEIPSLAGVWSRGVSIRNSPVAGIELLKAIRAAELIGASVILVAFFRDNCPDMNSEGSYGPVVELLKAAAGPAGDAGAVLGLENSLSPADNKKLVNLVGEGSVKVYYDLDNIEFYGHAGQAVPGIALLGKDRICQVHVKNEERLIEEPGRVDWRAAFEAFNGIGYDGWYVFESQHSGTEQLVESTVRNISFLGKYCRMPVG